MLDPKLLQEDPEKIRRMLAIRKDGFNLPQLLALDEKRRKLQKEVEDLRHTRKERSKMIGQMRAKGEDITVVSEEVREQGKKLDELEKVFEETVEDYENLSLFIPNIPHAGIPLGDSAEANPVIKEWGKKPTFSFKPKDHHELGEALGILDFARAAKISGARFALLRKNGALLERALINFMLDIHTQKHGYEEVFPPLLVNRRSITATGNLPKFAGDVFMVPRVGAEELFLIPTAEVPVTNIFQDETLAQSDLPKKFVAYTPCFRSEAGSYGKDTRGLIRQHQFNKVELVQFAMPDTAAAQHEELTRHAEIILEALGLAYRRIELCAGDLGFSSARTYDLEVWLPAQNTYREISSCSHFTDFQARRAKIRYKDDTGKSQYVHTINGSGLAVGRTLVAILENYQQADGTVAIPEVLRPYMRGQEVMK